MGAKTLKSKDFFNALKSLHKGMVSGIVLFGFFGYVLSIRNIGDDIIPGDVIQVVQWFVLLAVVASIALSQYIKNTRMASIREERDLTQKLPEYKSALLIKLTTLEVTAIVLALLYVFSSNLFFLALSLVIAVAMLMDYPSKSKVTHDLQLDDEETAKINDPESVVAIIHTEG